jgi:DNA-binding response OmpR family regulator
MTSSIVSTKQILICDDDRDIRDFLCTLLKESGYEPLEAADMFDVRYLLKNEHPRLMLLDICMPELDGFEIAECLHTHGETLPIIFITAHGDRFGRADCSIAGAAGYFTKPLDTDALLHRIETIIKETEPKQNP